MARFKQFDNGSFALKLSSVPNLWIPYFAGTPLDEALKDASRQTLQLENDLTEFRLRNPEMKNIDAQFFCMRKEQMIEHNRDPRRKLTIFVNSPPEDDNR